MKKKYVPKLKVWKLDREDVINEWIRWRDRARELSAVGGVDERWEAIWLKSQRRFADGQTRAETWW